MKRFITISLAFLFGCSAPEIDFPISEEIVVIEGWVTNENKPQWVKISQTVKFDDEQQENPVSDAIVSISDGSSNYTLTYDSDGIYLSLPFLGLVGEAYQLSVQLSDGRTIQSSMETLNAVPEIQSITTSTFIRQNPDTGEDVVIYFPIVETEDPADEVNYYRYKGFRNDILLNEPEQLELLNDQFINGKLLPHNISRFEYAPGDELKIELHSLSKSAFDFLGLLKLQTTSLGSSSGTAPATLKGNLQFIGSSDLVLGFFGASAVDSESIIVE